MIPRITPTKPQKKAVTIDATANEFVRAEYADDRGRGALDTAGGGELAAVGGICWRGCSCVGGARGSWEARSPLYVGAWVSAAPH